MTKRELKAINTEHGNALLNDFKVNEVMELIQSPNGKPNKKHKYTFSYKEVMQITLNAYCLGKLRQVK